jgi:hypothetical protein
VATFSPINSHPVPTDGDSPLGGTQIQTFTTHSEKFSNMRPTSASNRNTLIPTPAEGMEVYQQDINVKYIYNGSAWVPYVQGAKIIATDTGAGAVNTGPTAPGVTIHPSRTISDPFGTGVPYMLEINAVTLFDNGSTYAGSMDLVSPALSTSIVRRTRIGGGPTSGNILIKFAFPTGGSASYSTRLTETTSGLATYYADASNNYCQYTVYPLWT